MRAFWRDRQLDLTNKEFALLRYFMAHPGEVLSQERESRILTAHTIS